MAHVNYSLLNIINKELVEDMKPSSSNYQDTLALLHKDIKEEIDNNTNYEEQQMTTDIKTEFDNAQSDQLNDNPFQNIQLEVKQEINLQLILESETEATEQTIVTDKNIQTDNDQNSGNRVVIKEETQVDDGLVTYDHPNFDAVSMNSNETTVGSIDSYDAVALGNVEACLQEEMNIKYENESQYEENEKLEYNHSNVKMESDLPLTNMGVHTNASSTITSPPEGLPKDAVVKLPEDKVPDAVLDNTNFGLFQTNCAEENNESFQLNSITGNLLSLEQEAYGLLKAKKKKNIQSSRPYVCSECPKSYLNKANLKAHWDVHRSIERRAMGVIRGKQTRKENLKKKVVTEHPETDNGKVAKKEGYECTCGKNFRRRSRMETCLRSHNLFETDTRYVTCMTCSRSFKNKDELALHRKRLHRKRFPCKFCPTDYETRKELFKHLQIHQKVQLMEYKVISEVMKGKQKLRCFMCSKSWTELSELKNHVMLDHKEPFICPHCKNTFTKIIDFGNHTKTYHPEVEGQSVLDVLEAFSKLIQAWKCQECGQQFLEADKLALHQIEQHSPELKTEVQFQCTDCRRVFVSQKGLTSHRRIHHSTDSTEEAKEEVQGIMCLECRKVCRDMTALTSHMRLHSPERKYPCKFCDFRFATPEKRKTHSEIHTGDMKYVCFICEYQCSSENRLKQHKMSLKHANIKEYLLTGKPLLEEPQVKTKESSKKKDSVKRRKRNRESEKEVAPVSDCEVPCDICGDMFANEETMLEHKQTHPFIEFPNDDKPSRIFFK